MKKNFVAFTVGLVFALGLGISGMTQPQKVVGFLDVFGQWNPALAFVMIGAIGLHALLYPWITKRSSPLLADQFQIPQRKDLSPNLFVGAALFGMGWGLGGYCPGPAVASLATLSRPSLVFVGSMILGMLLFRLTKPLVDKALD